MLSAATSIKNAFTQFGVFSLISGGKALTAQQQLVKSASTNDSPLDSHTQQEVAQGKDAYKQVRKLIAWILPLIAMSSLTAASFFSKGALLEAFAEPIAEFLSYTSLAVIVSDMVATILPGLYETYEHLKSCVEHPSLKGFLYILSKLIPLHAMAALLIGNKYLGRIKSKLAGSNLSVIQEHSIVGKFINKQKVFPTINELASFVESVKARTSDLGGSTVISSPVRDFIRTWRAKILKEKVAPWISLGANNKNSKAFQLPILAMGTFLMSVWENLRVGAVDVLIKFISQLFPENSPLANPKEDLSIIRVK